MLQNSSCKSWENPSDIFDTAQQVSSLELQLFARCYQPLTALSVDEGAKRAWWSHLELKINENISEIETAGRHLKAINSISVWRLKRRAQSFSQKYNPAAIFEEPHTIKTVPIVEANVSSPVGINNG